MGPFYDLFPLTLSSGHRTEIAGPLYYHEQNDTQETWAVPPLFSYVRDPDVESEELDIAYPLLSYDCYGGEYRFHIFQVFAFAGGKTQDDISKRRFTLFPFYFQQRSPNPEDNYTALLPFYGILKNRLFRDEVHFILMPLYVATRKKDVVTHNYVYPFFHLRHGNALDGWQFWPIVGHEHKEPTTKTNSVDEVEIVGGHDKLFVLWPFFFKNKLGIGTDNPERSLTFLPLFTSSRSPKRDSSTYFWPFGLTITDDREKKYHEVGFPWPIIDFARGEGKHTSRVWPIYSRARNKTQESNFYLWPFYKYNRYHSDPLDRSRMRIMLFLYSDIIEKNTATGDVARRTDFLPFFTKKRDLDGNERLQVLTFFEPVLPNSKSIVRNFSQLWSLWRSEKNAKTGARSQSLLWNLYRRDITPAPAPTQPVESDGASKSPVPRKEAGMTSLFNLFKDFSDMSSQSLASTPTPVAQPTGPMSEKISLFFGLYQRETNAYGKSWRLFYVPVGSPARPANRVADMELDGTRLQDLSDSALSKALERIRQVAILRRDQTTFLQASKTRDGFVLERQDGSPSKRYTSADNLSLAQVIRAFASYARGDDAWKKDFAWAKVNW